MISKHRGHTIEVRREECLGGWPMLYYSIIRDSDGYFCVDNCSESDDYVRDWIKGLKVMIDAELEEDDPWGEHSRRLDAEAYGIAVL